MPPDQSLSEVYLELPKLRAWVSIPIAPLQILKDLRSGAGFHGFQNINVVANLHGKFGADLFERNYASVKHRRHRGGGMAHLLTNNGRVTPALRPARKIASGTLRQSVDRGGLA